jgi:hypothetical protein
MLFGSRWRWGAVLSMMIGAGAAHVACASTEGKGNRFAPATVEEPTTSDASMLQIAPDDAGVADVVLQCPSNKCLPFHLDCNGDASDGCEANIRSDIHNCGGCGVSCLDDGGTAPPYTRPACINGACQYICIDDYFFGPMRNCNGKDPMRGDRVSGCPNQILCDPMNCGACGVVAPQDPTGDRICMMGNPLPRCPTGTINCGGVCGNQCVNPNQDPQNCGTCGRKCPDLSVIPQATVLALKAKHIVFTCAGPNPDGGLPECKPTCERVLPPWGAQIWQDCDGDFESTVQDPTNPAYNGCEVNAFGNKDNCGACGKACQVVCHTKKGSPTYDQICDCPSGQTWCAPPGECVDTNNHPLHCGSCGNACPGPWDGGNGSPTCVGAHCGYKCKAGYADCNRDYTTDGCEVDTQNFHDHCGSCNAKCKENQRCGNGECQFENCDNPTR